MLLFVLESVVYILIAIKQKKKNTQEQREWRQNRKTEWKETNSLELFVI
jgi:hypothetical protein